jgi:hypothetical protein
MRVGQEGLAALGRPLDGAVELGCPGGSHVLGVQEDLGAEAAAHVGRDHAHLVLGQAQHEGRHQQALDVRVLVGHVQRVLVRGAVVAGVGGARLHGVGDQAVVDQVQLGDVRGAGEGGVHRGLVAQRPLVAVVVGRLVVQRRALGGGAHVDHRRQLLVVHLHQLGGVLGLLQRVGHHHGHVVAHVAHLLDRQDGVRRLLHRRAVGAGDQPAAGQAVDLAVDVGPGEDAATPGMALAAAVSTCLTMACACGERTNTAYF